MVLLISNGFIDLLCINLNIHMLCINLNIHESRVKPYILSKIHLRLFLYTVSTVYKNKNMDELPTHEICTIKIGNHEFRTYNLTINDGSTRKTLVFILSPLCFSSSS